KKLSKRDPEAHLLAYRDQGFLPEGLLNYLALLGWAIAEDRDVFTLEEMVAAFDVRRVNPNPARFDVKKADAINAAHMRMLTLEDMTARVTP
ncbi:glutamate--tRNA ligase family protein, partial [Klebsiella pneumoniae]